MKSTSCSSFDLMTSKLAHCNETHFLLLTFPAGQTERNAQGSRSLHDVLVIQCVMVLLEMCVRVPSNCSGHFQNILRPCSTWLISPFSQERHLMLFFICSLGCDTYHFNSPNVSNIFL